MKSVRIRSYSGPYFGDIVRIQKNTDQNNSEYQHFLRSDYNLTVTKLACIWKNYISNEIIKIISSFM